MRTTPARREKCGRVSCVVRKRNIKLDGEGVVGHGPSAIRFCGGVPVSFVWSQCVHGTAVSGGRESGCKARSSIRGCSHTRTVAFKDNLLALCACEADSCGSTHMHTVRLAWLHALAACGVHEGKGRHQLPYTHSPCSAGDDWTAKPSWLGEDTFSSTPMICFDAPIDALCTRTAWRGAAAIAREARDQSHSFPRSFGQMIAKHQNLGQVNKKCGAAANTLTASEAARIRTVVLSKVHWFIQALLGLSSACRTTRSHGSSLGRGRVRCSGLHSELVACGATRATPS